jgi:hypothetical protein
VESCPEKDAIFKVIRTWENARAANAFPRELRKLLAKPDKDWRLVEGKNKDTWVLYELSKGKEVTSFDLKRAAEY